MGSQSLIDGVFSIMTLLAGIALIALLLNKSNDVSNIATQGSRAYGSLLRTVMTGGSM